MKIPWSKADKKAKGDCFTTVKYLIKGEFKSNTLMNFVCMINLGMQALRLV